MDDLVCCIKGLKISDEERNIWDLEDTSNALDMLLEITKR